MPEPDEVVSPTRALAASLGPLLRQHWALLLVVGLAVRLLARRYLSPLRRYPGPVLASMTRLPRLASVLGGRTQHDRIALHRRYGPLVRTAPDELSVASPALAREVLRAGKGFRKTDFYAVFPPPENPDVFTETREDKHALLKRVAGAPYSMASMKRLGAFIDDTIDELAGRLAGFCAVDGGGGPPGPAGPRPPPSVDLGAWLHYFAFDVLGEVAFSRSFGFLAAGFDKEGAIASIDASQRYNGAVGQVPEWDRVLRRNPLCRLVPALDPGNSLITRIARDEMAKRQPFAARVEKQAMEADGGGDAGDGRRDLLDSLIQGHLKPGSGFSEMDVFSVAHGAIFAGSDSTASTMQSFFWLVLSHPRVHARLVAELEAAVAAGAVPAAGNVDWAQAQGLEYLQACLREAMRLRPAVGLDMTRVVPAGGAALDATTRLPGGTRVALNGWVLHRDAAVFGADADAFRPERWLDDADRARTMDKFLFQFGGGSHLCIGRNLALLEINKVLPRLLRDFAFRLVHPHRELRAKATFFVVQDGLDVYIERKHPAGAV